MTQEVVTEKIEPKILKTNNPSKKYEDIDSDIKYDFIEKEIMELWTTFGQENLRLLSERPYRF